MVRYGVRSGNISKTCLLTTDLVGQRQCWQMASVLLGGDEIGQSSTEILVFQETDRKWEAQFLVMELATGWIGR